jgi:hypothetical protein
MGNKKVYIPLPSKLKEMKRFIGRLLVRIKRCNIKYVAEMK